MSARNRFTNLITNKPKKTIQSYRSDATSRWSKNTSKTFYHIIVLSKYHSARCSFHVREKNNNQKRTPIIQGPFPGRNVGERRRTDDIRFSLSVKGLISTLVELSVARITRHGHSHGYPYRYPSKWLRVTDIRTDVQTLWKVTWISIRISARMSVSNYPCYGQFDQGNKVTELIRKCTGTICLCAIKLADGLRLSSSQHLP